MLPRLSYTVMAVFFLLLKPLTAVTPKHSSGSQDFRLKFRSPRLSPLAYYCIVSLQADLLFFLI